MSFDSKKLGRFTVSVDHTILEPIPNEENTFIDTLVNMLNTDIDSVQQFITSNIDTYNLICLLDMKLISFTHEVQQYLPLFNDTDILKHNIIRNVVDSLTMPIINTVIYQTLPLVIKFAYMKYVSSLLVLQPSDCLVIDADDFKSFLNKRCLC